MAEDTEYLKLPIDEQCVHKVWKARLHGYEEAVKIFGRITDEKSPEFSKYAGLLKKFVTDSNAVAQEKGLEAVLAFLANAALAPRTCGEVVSAVVQKCLNSPRTKTREKGSEIIMVYIELEKQEAVMEELLKGFTNKQPKIVAACCRNIREAIHDFGSKVIALKPVVKSFAKLLEHSDKTVREEAKMLAVELYRWIGNALKPCLSNIKPVQLKELEEEFEKLPSKPPKQTRFLKSQQDLKAAAEAAAGGDDEEEEEEDEEEVDAPVVDAYELMEAVDVLSKIPKDFYDNMEEKKWQIRKEALETLLPLVSSPKIEPGDFGDLARVLKKTVAKDTNVMIVALAAKCLTGLANGIRKKFSPYAAVCMSTILEKFKEKKIAVVTALRDASDAIFPSTSLQNLQEDLIAALDSKNPSIRAETALFLSRAFRICTVSMIPKAVLKPLCTTLVKKLADTFPEVRDGASLALATCQKVVGEKPMLPFLNDLDKLKVDKINECAEKVELNNGTAPKKASKPKQEKKPEPKKEEPAKAPPKKGGARPKSASAKPAASKPAGKKPAKKKSPANEGADDMKSEPLLSDEDVLEQATAALSAPLIQQLESANWKERLAAMEEFTTKVHNMDKDNINTQVFIRIMCRKPGWKEANFQVLNAKVCMVGILAEKARFSRRTASCIISGLVDKIGDIKSGGKVKESMTAVAEATQLGYIVEEMVKYAFDEQKNPKNQAETLSWVSQAIQEFGFTTVNVKPLIPYIKKALAAVNPQVRTAAITLMGVMYMYMGGVLRSLFESEKAALLAQIDAEFEKVAGNQPPAPFRGLKSKVPGANDAAEDEDEDEDEDDEAGGGGGAGGGGMNLADLVPRTDISGQITSALIEELSDAKWKIRGEALDKVATILKDAGHITPNLGELAGALKARLGDSNKLLQTTTANICGTIASAMGPPVKAYVTRLVPGLFLLTADMKPTVRAAAMAALNAFEEQVGLAPFIEDEILSTALNVDKPFLRIEIFGWLTEKLGKYRTLPADLALSVQVLFAALEDRNGDVRKQAQAALPLFMMHLDYNKMVKMTGKLKPSSKTNVCGIMEKQRPNIPEKPGKPSTGKAGGKKKKAVEEVSPVSEEEVERPASKGKRPKSAPAKPDTSSVSSSASSSNETAPSSAPSTGAKKAKQPAAAGAAKAKSTKSTKKGKGDDDDSSPPLIMNNGKDKRLKDEQDLKVLKWNFTTPRAEYIDQLKDQMQNCVSKTMMTQLFHADFKYHIQALNTLTENLDSYKDATMASLDVLLKYLTIRFFDTNTSVIMKVLQYLKAVFTFMAQDDLSLREHEASSFIPYLISKVGDNKENIRKDVRAVMRLVTKVYPSSKMFGFIMDGLKSKNSRQRTECLEELGCLIELYGINVCQPSPPKSMKEIAGQIGDRDNSVRSAALNALVQGYQMVGDDIYKYVGHLSDKDMGMLEERIKRSAKKNAAAPPPKTAPAAQQRDDKNAKPDPKKSGLPNPSKAQRPGTAPSGVRNGPASSCPKTFSLELEKLGLERSESEPEMPKLHDTNVDEILSEPVVMPKRRLQKSPLPTIMQLNFMISQVASNDLSVSIKSLAKLDEVLKEPERNKILKDHVDQLLVATSLQLRMAFSKHMGDVTTSRDVVLMCRCMVALLMSLFHSRPLAQEASKDVLCDLLNGLVTVLLDDRLMALEGGPQVMRSVNVLLVKVVENADHSNTMGALIKLLQDCAARESSAPKFVQLVMKCLWRMVRMMPNIIDTLKVDRVLLDLHQFLKAFPSHSWRDRPSDTPLRTVKTILHSMAKIHGEKILSYQTLITDPENSEMDGYLKRVLKSNRLSQGSMSSEPVNGSAETERGSVQNGAKMSPRRAPTRTNDILAEIFKKVGSKENTREGLAELYDFKQKYPDVDIDPFLKKTSQIFQSYIERGLKSIAQERQGKGNVTVPTVPKPQSSEEAVPSDTQVSPTEDEITSANVLRERIKVLRARCGLDNGPDIQDNQPTPADKTETSRSSVEDSLLHSEHHSSHHHHTNERPGRHLYNPERISLGSSSTSVAANPVPSSSSDTNVEDLKKRLQRIKSSLKK